MIRPHIIGELYTKHSNKVGKNGCNLSLLEADSITHHSILLDNDNAILGNLKKESPLYKIPLRNIIGLENLDNHVAIILKNSIIFLSKPSNDIKVHIKFDL